MREKDIYIYIYYLRLFILTLMDLGPISSIVDTGPKTCIRLQIEIEIRLDIDQSKQSSLKIGFLSSNWLNSNTISISISI